MGWWDEGQVWLALIVAWRALGDPSDMTRLPRFDRADVPQQVVQWGNNRLPFFLDDEDRQRYLQCLRQALLRFGCRLHVYMC